MSKQYLQSVAGTLRKSPLELMVITTMVFALVYMALPTAQALADEGEDFRNAQRLVELEVAALQNNFKPYGELPEADGAEPLYTKAITVTAYNSVPGQTDATPCIGAQGTNICTYYLAGEQTCAANFVPLGTELYVEGLGMCTVRDRMNSRYYYRVDWYMHMDVTAARQFGVQTRDVSVYNL